MLKMFISIRKNLYTKPKWKFLRIHTKVIQRKVLEDLKGALEGEIVSSSDEVNKSFLEGQLNIINLLLKGVETQHKKSE